MAPAAARVVAAVDLEAGDAMVVMHPCGGAMESGGLGHALLVGHLAHPVSANVLVSENLRQRGLATAGDATSGLRISRSGHRWEVG
jgi:hypothetical protein